jgi:nucleotide-binding universal stress UspA family protein
MGGLAVCLDGVEDEELVAAAAPWAVRFDWVEIWCAFGDLAARELQHLRDRHGRPPPPPPPHRQNDIDREQAEAVAERGLTLMRQANLEARASRILGGRDPGHALAAASGPDVALLLAAGHQGGTGPKSLGHVARFVIDHATGPVIVLRLR